MKKKRDFFKFKNVELVNGIDNEFIFKDTFNIINSVKFIITIDTAINHIAGYLEKKTFLLLNFPSSFIGVIKVIDQQTIIIILYLERRDLKIGIQLLINC